MKLNRTLKLKILWFPRLISGVINLKNFSETGERKGLLAVLHLSSLLFLAGFVKNSEFSVLFRLPFIDQINFLLNTL